MTTVPRPTRQSGPRSSTGSKRPVWMSVLTALIVLVIYIAQSKGLIGAKPQTQQIPQQTQQPTSQQSPQQASQQPSQPVSQPAQTTPSKPPPVQPAATRQAQSASTASDGGIAELFRKKQSDAWVEASGTIKKVLPDDTSGDKHQRFIVRMGTGMEILIAHNIDAAPRVPAQEGDTIAFRGEYEYTDKGGTVHFTHAPKFKRKDPGGWIEFGGKRYE